MKKRGLSEVITSLIIILLVLVAIGIVWIVTKNILNESSEKIMIEPLTNDIKIDEAKVGLLTANVKITRTQGDANMTSLKFVVNGKNPYTYEEKNPSLFQLESKTYTIPINTTDITSISVAPIFGKTIGIEKTKNIQLDYNTDSISNYWNFNSESNAKGAFMNGAKIILDSERGEVLSLDNNSQQWVNVLDEPTLNVPAQNFTLSVWIKTSFPGVHLTPTDTNTYALIISKFLDSSPHTGYGIWMQNGTMRIQINNISNNPGISYNYNKFTNIYINDSKWHFLAMVSNGTELVPYIDGAEVISTRVNNTAYSSITNISNSAPFCIGQRCSSRKYYFNGSIDDISLFSRALTPQEIQQLYNSQK